MGYQILAISPDRPEKLQEPVEKHGFRFQLLSDSTMECAHAFGLAYTLDDQTYKAYQGFGIDLEDASGETHHMLPVPAVFVLGTDGKITFEYVNPNHRVRLHPDVLLVAAKVALEV